MVSDFQRAASKRCARDVAKARALLRILLGRVKIEVETHGGPKVPVAVLNGNARALLTTMAAGTAAIDKW